MFVQDVATEEGGKEAFDFPMDDGRSAASNGAGGGNGAASTGVCGVFLGDVKPNVSALSLSSNVLEGKDTSGDESAAHKGSGKGNEAERSNKSGADGGSGIGAEDVDPSGSGAGEGEGSGSRNGSRSGSEFSEDSLEPWKVEEMLDLDLDLDSSTTIPASDCHFGGFCGLGGLGDAENENSDMNDADNNDADMNDVDTNGENNVNSDENDHDAENENSEYETISGNAVATREDAPEGESVPSGGFWTWMTRRIKNV